MNSIDAKINPVDIAIKRVQKIYNGWRRDTPVEKMRADWDALFPFDPTSVATEAMSIGGVDTLSIAAAGVDKQRVLIYFHGGGFKLGSVHSHSDLMANISAAAGCRVLGLNYRLAPEHRFPAPIEDAVAVYEWLLTQGNAAQDIAFAGDSAGGGLAVSALLALREKNLPLPAAVVMLSAWTDLTADSESYTTRAEVDPIHQRPMILATAKNYLGDADPRNPLASPLFGDLAGLPPMLLQVGDRETGLDDSTRFADKLRAADVDFELEIYPEMIHVFQQFPDLLLDARQAIESIGNFLRVIWCS